MEYYEFKIAYDNNTDLIPKFSKCQKTLFELQTLFDENFNSVFLGNSFSYTIWYNSLLSEFKNVFDLNLTDSGRLLKVIEIYKELFLRCSEMNSHLKASNQNHFSNLLIKKCT